jgi:hypothetical protein
MKHKSNLHVIYTHFDRYLGKCLSGLKLFRRKKCCRKRDAFHARSTFLYALRFGDPKQNRANAQYSYATHSLSNLSEVVTIVHDTCSYWVELLFLYHPPLVSIKVNDTRVIPKDFSYFRSTTN